jgi:plastocyanin
MLTGNAFLKRITCTALSCLVLYGLGTALSAQTSAVTGRVNLVRADGKPRTGNAGIVVWLTPIPKQRPAAADRSRSLRPRQIIQRNKRFETRVLAVEVGTVVDFPNRDPFFHNVFSLFEGTKFDLGLYEAGATKDVQFNKPGVCYIFCNIHSQMNATVVVVDTPYFVQLDGPGQFQMPQVPPGRYQLNVWAERCSPKALKDLSRQVNVETGSVSLGTIQLEESRDLLEGHSNKYGKEYDASVFSSPIYVP